MYPDIPQPIFHQPQLLILDESVGTAELFPTVWSALEDLTKEDLESRSAALQLIKDLNAARISPVVSYMLVTRITEPDLELRANVVEVLSGVLTVDENGLPASEEVRNSLKIYLSSIRTRQIYDLLQVSDAYPSLESCVALLLNSSPFGGNHLVDILIDRKIPLGIRKQAALMIGKVGYLYTLPTMERIAGRLETFLAGQTSMSFISPAKSNEAELLPLVQEAIHYLKSN